MSPLGRLKVRSSSNEKSLLLLGLIAHKFARRIRGLAKLADQVGFELAVRF